MKKRYVCDGGEMESDAAMPKTRRIELSASQEDYLEAIYRIIETKKAARAKDIGDRLHVGRSSVTGALRALASRDLINYTPYDIVTLTQKGQTVAEDVVRRHEVLRDFFTRVLKVDAADAETAACKMEHAVPENILQRFLDFVEFVDRCPRGGAGWLAEFSRCCDHDASAAECERCIKKVLKTVHDRKTGPAGQREAARLSELEAGDKATIHEITVAGEIGRRLTEMGAAAGTLIEVENVAPQGDPIEIKVQGYHLTLREEEARGIRVVRAPP